MMKKSTLRLSIRHETLRVLARLDLIRVAGGSPEAQLMDTGGSPANTCVQAVVPPKP
jgi:hypothetical protein